MERVLMFAWLRWLFSDSGIMMVPNTDQPIVEYLKNYKLKAYNCKVCGAGVWKRGGKRTVICKSFKCFKKNGGKWN